LSNCQVTDTINLERKIGINPKANHYCLFVPSLFSCHEKATMALYFERIRTRLGIVHFRVFRLFLCLLTTEFAACSKPPSRDNHRKAPYGRRKNSA